MRKISNTNNHKVIKIALIVAACLVVVGVGAYVAYAYTVKDEIKRDENGISTERTPEDKQLEENLNNNPEDKVNNTQTDTPQAPTIDEATNLQNVNVILTNAGQTGSEVSASGFISNTVESNGVCSYVFTNGQTVITKTSLTLTNANSTTCSTVRFATTELFPGEWNAQLQYKSSASQGSSNELKVIIK